MKKESVSKVCTVTGDWLFFLLFLINRCLNVIFICINVQITIGGHDGINNFQSIKD
ncbi:hypothetical protein I7V34_16355 [Bacillus sp. V3]|nr:hypothetical protein I7V34_16355 [Bacillus sp. V3]